MSIRIDGTNTTANPGITGGDADTGLQFGTDEVSIVTGGTNRATVESNGNFTIENGNLVLASGSGIDFSATPDSGTSNESELFADYEHGRWTPTIVQGADSVSSSRNYYIKVGDVVHLTAALTVSSGNGSVLQIGGLPYAVNNTITMGFSGANPLTGHESVGAVMANNAIFPAGATQITAYLYGGNNSIQFYFTKPSASWVSATGNQISTVIVTLTYLAS